MEFSFAIIFVLAAAAAAPSSEGRSFESIISFGDSITDTGNGWLLSPADNPPHYSLPPYGRTYFGRPTGRCSDGRLIVDFLAESVGLPLVEAYMAGERGRRNLSKGVNLAVVGATALDSKIYEDMGIATETNASLGVQLEWFKQFLASIPDGKCYVEKSLILMGEIGGNDYNHPIMQGTDPQFIRSLVQPVINYIGSTIEEVIRFGAKTMVVPGNLPMGCLPVYLTQFQNSTEPEDYDPRTGCINWLNDLAIYHDELLLNELSRIRKLHPHITIVFADYFNAALRLYLSPAEFGFSEEDVLKACCGGGGEYNYDGRAECGFAPSKSCEDPSLYVSWDGIHFTEAAYRKIASASFQPLFTTLSSYAASSY